MSLPLDDSAEKVQAFCELLKAAIPLLESGSAGLVRLAHGLSDSDSHLSLELDHLGTDVEGLKREAETSEGTCTTACEALSHAAEEAKTTSLLEVEIDAAEDRSHWVEVLQQNAKTLDTTFQQLKTNGWEPLGMELTSEKGDFERWTHEADEPFNDVVQILDSTTPALQHEGSEAKTAAQDMTDAAPFAHGPWQQMESNALSRDALDRFDQASRGIEDALAWQGELGHSVVHATDEVREHIDSATHKSASAIDAQAGEAAQAFTLTATALERAQIEFERGVLQADDARTDAQGLAELAGRVAEADAKLQKIHTATEAVGQ